MAASELAHPLPDLRPLEVSGLAASQRPEPLLSEASAVSVLLRLRPAASGLLPLAALVISEASVVLADLAMLPLLAPLRLRRLASVLAQHLFLPLVSVLPASLRLRS